MLALIIDQSFWAFIAVFSAVPVPLQSLCGFAEQMAHPYVKKK
jgi:hypothetical protein